MSDTQTYKIILSGRAASLVVAACAAKIASLTANIEGPMSEKYALSTHLLEMDRAALLDVVDGLSTGLPA